MGGFSVVLLMGPIIGFALLVFVILVSYYIWQVLKYLLYSFSLLSKIQTKKVFIPIYNKYLFGKLGVNKVYGILLAISSFIKLVFDIWFLDFWLKDVNLLLYNIIPDIHITIVVAIFLAYYLLHCICASKIYEKECNKTVYIILTVFSYLSLGMLIPILLFFINKIKKK